MTEQDAAADNACRDGAPRGARAPRKGPRAPGPPLPSEDLGPGSLACGWVSQSRPRRFRKPPGRLPALHPSPMGEAKENRKTGAAGRPKNKTPAQRSVGCKNEHRDLRHGLLSLPSTKTYPEEMPMKFRRA